MMKSPILSINKRSAGLAVWLMGIGMAGHAARIELGARLDCMTAVTLFLVFILKPFRVAFAVVPLRKYCQVGGVIIQRISVDVMNYFINPERSSKMLLHNVSMQQHSAPIDRGAQIASDRQRWGSGLPNSNHVSVPVLSPTAIMRVAVAIPCDTTRAPSYLTHGMNVAAQHCECKVISL